MFLDFLNSSKLRSEEINLREKIEKEEARFKIVKCIANGELEVFGKSLPNIYEQMKTLNLDSREFKWVKLSDFTREEMEKREKYIQKLLLRIDKVSSITSDEDMRKKWLHRKLKGDEE